MKKYFKLCAFLLAMLLLFTALPLAGSAYGASDQKLIITHINVAPSYEGSAIIVSGASYGKLGSLGTFAWWRAVIFDWDAKEEVYKVVDIYTNGNNSDKSGVTIPETGFAYGICIGNDYSASGGINYVTQRIKDSYNYIANIKIGDKAYLYGTDLANAVVINNGKIWYSPDFVSDSYIKIGTPEADTEAYNPNKVTLLPFNIVPNAVDKVNYASGASIIMTDNYGDYVNYTGGGNFEWWQTVVFDWDDNNRCYTVVGLSRATGNSSPKQPIIPENGFALLDCAKNQSAINNLKIGSQCWLYDIDLEKGTLGSNPRIRVNVEDKNANAFIPSYTDPRLTSPSVDQGASGEINTTPDGVTITWDAINGADGYMVAINDASFVSDGMLEVKPTLVTENSYKIPSSFLEVGGFYTLYIYAVGENYTPSMVSSYLLKCRSENAINSSLKDKTIVAFGDSLTERTGYVQMLYGYIGTEVINSGVGGDNTNHGKARFEDAVLNKNPDIAIICFGMNDQAGVITSKQPNISLKVYRENLEYFAKTLTEAGCDVVFVTPNPVCTESGYYVSGAYGLNYGFGFMDSFCNAMRQVAIKYNCGLVDINRECDFEDLTQFLIKGDGIHQTPYGHKRYAEHISDYLLAAYDNIDKATMTLKCVDTEGNTLKTVEFVGKSGANITLAAPEIEGLATTGDIETTFEDGAEFTLTYVKANLVLSDGSSLVVDEENCIIKGVLPATKAEDLLKNFENEGLVIRDQKDTEDIGGNKLVGTGALLKYGEKTYTVIVKGDVNGNGDIDTFDYAQVKRAYLGTFEFDSNQSLAADLNGNGTLDVTEYGMIKRAYLGTYEIK